jgi:hypothetical protein
MEQVAPGRVYAGSEVPGLAQYALKANSTKEECYAACDSVVAHFELPDYGGLLVCPRDYVLRRFDITISLANSITRGCRTAAQPYIHTVKLHFPVFVFWNYLRPILTPGTFNLNDKKQFIEISVRDVDVLKNLLAYEHVFPHLIPEGNVLPYDGPPGRKWPLLVLRYFYKENLAKFVFRIGCFDCRVEPPAVVWPIFEESRDKKRQRQ